MGQAFLPVFAAGECFERCTFETGRNASPTLESIVNFHANNLDDIATFAAEVAVQLQPRDCLLLHGDLGAGKTTFVRALVGALGGNVRLVSSPTFVLLNIYPTLRMTVYHLDAYRVSGADELDAIGFGELLDDPNGLVIVEWPSRAAEALPARRVELTIETTGETSRRFTLVRQD